MADSDTGICDRHGCVWVRTDGSGCPACHREIARLRAALERAKAMLRNWSPEYVAELDAMMGAAETGTVAPASAPLTETYVQEVPDHCDRIVWRGYFYALPPGRPVQPGDGQ